MGPLYTFFFNQVKKEEFMATYPGYFGDMQNTKGQKKKIIKVKIVDILCTTNLWKEEIF